MRLSSWLVASLVAALCSGTILRVAAFGPSAGPAVGWSTSSSAAVGTVGCACQAASDAGGEEAPTPAYSEGLGKGKPTTRRQLVMAAEALDMQWNMADAGKAATCSQCRGSRTFECRFCHGTGWLKMNGKLIRGEDGAAASCPVCKTRGEEPCDKCHGTGHIASWLKPQIS